MQSVTRLEGMRAETFERLTYDLLHYGRHATSFLWDNDPTALHKLTKKSITAVCRVSVYDQTLQTGIYALSRSTAAGWAEPHYKSLLAQVVRRAVRLDQAHVKSVEGFARCT